jgi:hypothetical protein
MTPSDHTQQRVIFIDIERRSLLEHAKLTAVNILSGKGKRKKERKKM